MSVFFPQTYNYKPFSVGGLEKGRYTSTYLSSTTFVGNIQPASQEEIDSLNIGRATKGIIKIISDTIFNIAKEGTNINGDIIEYDSNEWEVIKVNPCKGLLLPHRSYFAELRNEGDLN